MFDNIKNWFLTCLSFVLWIHYFACFWIVIESIKETQGVKNLGFVEETIIGRYVESFYLITTTITTVGYGDYKAFNDSDPVWTAEMLYLSFVTLCGIMIFSSVTNQIFIYQRL